MADTGPILHLHQAGLLGLLRLEESVRTTPIVRMEWHRKVRGESFPDWLVVEVPSPSARRIAENWERRGLLDSGEAEALAVAQETGDEGFLTDDTDAREFAQTKGYSVRGSLGVLLMAVANGYLPSGEAANAWKCLAQHSTLWISPALRRETTDALERIIAKNRSRYPRPEQ